jgi:two-component system osmolarity sensor histidine kinase EnvZ
MLSETDQALTAGLVTDLEDIDAIIGQFLDFARDDGGEAVEAEADLNAIVNAVLERYARTGKSVQARVSELPPIPLRPLAIQRLIVNLVENALRYSGTAVEIEVRLLSAGVVIAVMDRGPGIPANETARMLQPFTRLQASRGGATGSGLGLAIVQRIAAMHRGRFELLARAGGGLEARVTLPLTQPI